MFKVGDKVVVKSYDEIRQTLGDTNLAVVEMHKASDTGTLYFSPHMISFCNKTFTIERIYAPDDIQLQDHMSWTFCRAWLRPEKLDNRRIGNV
jgi:hypothetical protein